MMREGVRIERGPLGRVRVLTTVTAAELRERRARLDAEARRTEELIAAAEKAGQVELVTELGTPFGAIHC